MPDQAVDYESLAKKHGLTYSPAAAAPQKLPSPGPEASDDEELDAIERGVHPFTGKPLFETTPAAEQAVDYAALAKKHGLTYSTAAPQAPAAAQAVDYRGLAQKHGLTITPPARVPGMELLGGVPPGPPKPPLVQLAERPQPHMTPEGAAAQDIREAQLARTYPGGYQGFLDTMAAAQSRMGGGRLPDQSLGLLAGPLQAGLGAREVYQAVKPGIIPAARLATGIDTVPQVPPGINPQQAASGLGNIIGGGLETLSPLMAEGAAIAPIRTAATVGAGMLADKATREALKHYGVDDSYADLGGSIIGLLAGYGASRVRLRPEQQTLIEALKGEPSASDNRTVESLKTMVDRGGTENERIIAQAVLKRKYGIVYGETAAPAAAAPAETKAAEPAAPPVAKAAPAAAPKADTSVLDYDPVEAKMEAEIQRQEQEEIAKRRPTATAAPQPEIPQPQETGAIPQQPVAPGPQPITPPSSPGEPAQEPEPQQPANPLQAALERHQAVVEESKAKLQPVQPRAEEGALIPQRDVPMEAVPEQQIPSAAVVAPAEERGPGWVGNIPTSEIQVDAPRFQFKRNVGQGGAGEELRGIEQYDPEKAGIVSVWKDPADGKTYVINGHHRVELAQRTGYPTTTVRYLDAKTAQEARTKGAMINIAEGRGESTDAAKIFRDEGMTEAADLAQKGLSIKGKLASEGLALSKLAQPIFDDVIQGNLSPARGAVIGAGVPNHADQQALYELIKKREKGGQRLTNNQMEELIRMTNRAPTVTESTADQAQASMFGEEEMTRSLLPEKAVVSDYVREQLGKEKKLFSLVGTQAAAEKLGERGNVIKAGENLQVAQQAHQGIALYDKLSLHSGPIDTILNQAAKRIADGEPSGDVKQQAYRQIRNELTQGISRLTGAPDVGVRRVEGHDREGPHQEHGVRAPAPAEEEPGHLEARRPRDTSTPSLFEEPEPAKNALQVASEKRQQQVAENKAKLTPAEHPLFEGDEGQRVEGTTPEKLQGEQLTAQVKSGMAFQPSKLKPTESRGLFDEGPEQETLFARRPVNEWKPGTSLDRLDPEKLNIPQEGERLLIEDVARYLERQVRKTLGKVPRNASQEVKRARLLDLARKELKDQLDRPRKESGIDWYGKDTRLADRDLFQVFPYLATNRPLYLLQKAISAAVANNQNPRRESLTGALIWDDFDAAGLDKLPMLQASGAKWPGRGSDLQMAKIQRMLDDMGVEGFAKWMTSQKTGREIKRWVPNAKGLRMDEKYPGALVLGPKIGRYFLDIAMLPSDGTTVDVWDVRGQQRRLGTLFDRQGEMIAAPESVLDRPLFTSIHQILGKEFGLQPKAVQSLLWHYEQALYRKMGMGTKSYKRSDGTLDFLRTKGLDRSDERGPGRLQQRAADQRAGGREPAPREGRVAPVEEGQPQPDQPGSVRGSREGTEGPVKETLFSRRPVPGFYSQLQRAIEDKLPAKASAMQVKAIVSNPQNGVKADELKWSGLDDFLKEHPGTLTKQEVLDHLRANEVKVEEVEPEKTKFSQHVTPGGKNYRELLMTLPESSARLNMNFQQWADTVGEKIAWDNPQALEYQRARYDATKHLVKQAKQQYQSPHWSEPNVLVHVRLDDRTGPNGEKILHVEEIQSDWHQQGRKHGYGEASAPRGWETPAETGGKVPAAPFSKTWHELAFRRTLRYAAEHGYDQVTWNTGEQQAERFDLSKQLDTLQWDHNPDGSYDLIGRKDGHKVVGKESISADELENFVGKELAQKIVDGVGAAPDNRHIGKLTGLDLKVGGEGMKGFYDQILPAYANKYAKKWGAKVGETQINAGTSPEKAKPVMLVSSSQLGSQYFRRILDAGESWQWEDFHEKPMSPRYDSRAEAMAHPPQHPGGNAKPYVYVDDTGKPIPELNREGTQTVHSINITPAMRESVMQGQPLFARPKYRDPNQLDLFTERATTPETLSQPQHRSTTFQVDPEKLPRLENAEFPEDREKAPAYWKGAVAQAHDLGGRAAVLVNNAGMDVILQRMRGGSGDTSEEIYGMTLLPREWNAIPEAAEFAKQHPVPGGFDDALVRVAKQIGGATDKPLIVIQTGPSVPDDELKRVAEEEFDHAAQLDLPQGLQSLPIDRILDMKEGKIAADALHAGLGYPKLNPIKWLGTRNRAILTAEIGARLMRPGLHQELGLSPQQARNLAEQFILGLQEKAGPAAGKMVDQIYEAIGKNQAAEQARPGGLEKQYQKGAPGSGDIGRRGPPEGAGSDVPGHLAARKPKPPFLEGLSSPWSKGSNVRKPGSPAFTQTLAEQDKDYGLNVRNWFTSRRDVWTARVNQVLESLRKIVPDPIDQEALAIYRDFKGKPGELKQWLAGTHPVYGEVQNLTHARENIEKLRKPIERALNPTDAMKEADQALTKIAAASLAEGQRLGFIDKHVKPEEYVTHLLTQASEEGAKWEDQAGKLLGNKIGLNFPYNKPRNFPTLLDAAAHNWKPRTLNAFTAFQTYGDKFATARATHLLKGQLQASGVGVYGTKGGKNVPQDWKELAPHAHLFRNVVSSLDEQGEPRSSFQPFFVPPVIDSALKPITDPDYTSKIAGFRKLRVWQSYTKAAQLGLSFFHAVSLNFGAFANQGPAAYLKFVGGLSKSMEAPGFHDMERDLIAHGGTTQIQGKVYEAYSSAEPSSLPTATEALMQLPGFKQFDQTAKAITELTFGKVQRGWKVADYSLHKAAWLAKHPDASAAEQNAAMRSIAKELNAVYGGIHWENMGVNKSTLESWRLLTLAPDWTYSNYLLGKYAFEGGPKAAGHQIGSKLGLKPPPEWEGPPAGNMARAYWLRATLFGLAATQAMSLFLGHKLSKRPTQVYHGLGPDGKEIYQNMFFKGAAGDAVNLTYNLKDYGFPVGLLRTLGNKLAPGLRTAGELSRNETFLGQPIVPKGLSPLVGTARGTFYAAKGLAPIPWSATNIAEMMMHPEKYKKQEILTTLFAGTPPTHVKPKPDKGETQSIMQQLLTGKPYAPIKRGSEADKLHREQRRLLK